MTMENANNLRVSHNEYFCADESVRNRIESLLKLHPPISSNSRFFESDRVPSFGRKAIELSPLFIFKDLKGTPAYFLDNMKLGNLLVLFVELFSQLFCIKNLFSPLPLVLLEKRQEVPLYIFDVTFDSALMLRPSRKTGTD